MTRIARQLSVFFLFFVGIPSVALAQASIAGQVKDTSGAVLPGVTVEASSPALIEKTRSVVTDGTGLYKIEQLRPGTYTVTFTLTGFNTVKRDGIELTGAFAATVNANLPVGTVAETVTVTGESPIVDLQSVTVQHALTKDVIDVLPTGRSQYALANLIPGMTTPVGFVGLGQDVGGSVGDTMQTMAIHGGRTNDQRVTFDGLSTANAEGSGQFQSFIPSTSGVQEITVDTSAVSAELPGGGVRVNIVPRDGGNVFRGTFFGSFVPSSFIGSNLTDELRARGLQAANSVSTVYDVNPGLGGPIVRDKLWFFLAFRKNSTEQTIAGPGSFRNLNVGNPNAWTFSPDLSSPGVFRSPQRSANLRLTWQVNSNNKLSLYYDNQYRCYCPRQSSSTSPEAATTMVYPGNNVTSLTWSSPVTSRLLFEAGGSYLTDRWWQGLPDARFVDNNSWASDYNLVRNLTPVSEQSNGVSYRNVSGGNWDAHSWVANYRASVSYVTGAHAAKVGFGESYVSRDITFSAVSPDNLSFRLNGGVPNQITEFARPYRVIEKGAELGVYAQDRWTVGRATMNLGVRFDYYGNGFPGQHLGPAVLAPNRNIDFPDTSWVSWKDITPRLGVVYDVFGNGKTAVRASLSKYMVAQGLQGAYGDGSSPPQLLANQVTRQWIDGNNNFIPDCNLLAPGQQDNRPSGGDFCGAISDVNFGQPTTSLTVDPSIIRGWGVRPYNWEFSAGVQHQLLPRMSVDLGYFRRWYGNFAVTDNRKVAPTDYSPYSITAPIDSRLPSGGGYVVSGLFDLNTNKVGQVDNYFTAAANYGKQYEHWNGVDASVNLRLQGGVLLQGGLSTGRTSTDNCDVVTQVGNPSPLYCHVDTAFLTQLKLLGSYPVPKVDARISATFQSIPGPQITANYIATNAEIAPSLGRNLSQGQNATINIVAPGTMYGDRMNQLDLRLSKSLKAGSTRSTLNLDVFNVLNNNAALVENNNFAVWRTPTQILQARYAKLSVQFDF